MASEANPRVLVETDFLFGLRSSDPHHRHVLTALDLHRNHGLSIDVLSSAVIEVQTVLRSRGLGRETIENALSLMDAILAQHEVREFVPFELCDAVLSEKLRAKYESVGFFDSLHAAASHRLGVALLTSEGVYAKLGAKIMDLDKI